MVDEGLLEDAIFKAIARRVTKEGSLSGSQVSETIEQEIGHFLARVSPEVKETMLAQLLKDRCARLVYRVFTRVEARMAQDCSDGREPKFAEGTPP